MARLVQETKHHAENQCQLNNESSYKTISVVSHSGIPDKCTLLISNSTVIDNFNIQIEITNNTNTCETGIEYINPQHPRIVSLKDGRSLVCSFKVYPNIMKKLEKTRGQKYFGKYWMMVSQFYSENSSFKRIFFMHNEKWWKDNNYNSLELRPSEVVPSFVDHVCATDYFN